MAKLKISDWQFGCIMAVLVLGTLGTTFGVMVLKLGQGFSSPYVVEICSPTNPDYRVLLYEEGFVDRSILVCVSDPEATDREGKPVQWKAIYDDLASRIGQMAWTNDGQVLLVSPVTSTGVWASAYDYSSSEYIAGAHFSGEEMTLIKERQPMFDELINQHGGLSEEAGFPEVRHIESLSLMSNAREIWYWNEPGIDRSWIW